MMEDDQVKASFVDLRRKMRQVLKALERNEPVTLSYHGKEKAVLLPKAAAKPSTPRSTQEHPAFGMWKDRKDMKDPAAWVRKVRRPRRHAD
jgi:prevent-host-death family protein